MKSLIATLALCLGNLAFAQQTPTYLELNSPKSGVSCETDAEEREILLEKIEGDTNTKIGSYQGKGCKFSTNKKLDFGKYSFTVSGLTIQKTSVEFEVTPENQEKIVQ